MEGKKQLKITLGTAICIFIIIILVAALVGTVIYYNKNNEKENVVKSDNVEELNGDKIEKEAINIEEWYIFSSSNEYQATYSEFQKIGFSSDDKFLIETSMFTVTGQCELTDNNIKRCKIEKYYFDEPDGRKEHSLADADWFIEFKILENDKLEVVSNNIEGESEFSIVLTGEFGIGAEFTKYNIQEFMGTWNSSYAYMYDEVMEKYIKVESLMYILGSSYSKNGSKFTFNKDGSFEDYVYPITESDMYREGQYTFDNCNEITLKYVDGDKEVKIYIINENTIVYDNGYNKIFLVNNNNEEKKDEEIKNEYVGIWNTKVAFDMQGREVELSTLLGSGYAQYGSKLILNEDGTFENYIEPIQSGEISNTGTWEYIEYPESTDLIWGKIILKYDDREENLDLFTGMDSMAGLIYSMSDNYQLELYK